jgi:hypothetical protein
MTIYNLSEYPADFYTGLDIADLPDNQGRYIASLMRFPKPPTQIDLAACAKLIAEFCVAKLPSGARVLIGGPNFLMHWLEVELCAEGFHPLHPFWSFFEVAGLVEVAE